MEREATPRLSITLSIQPYFARLSLANAVSILEILGVERVRSAVHNWVHKADPQPEEGRSPDCVAADETVIRPTPPLVPGQSKSRVGSTAERDTR